jgi:hypothetical protein
MLTVNGHTFQMSSQYSAIARSDENLALRAVVRIDIFAQARTEHAIDVRRVNATPCACNEPSGAAEQGVGGCGRRLAVAGEKGDRDAQNSSQSPDSSRCSIRSRRPPAPTRFRNACTVYPITVARVRARTVAERGM